MKPVIDQTKASAELMEAYTYMRSFFGNEQYKSVIDWVDGLIAMHQAHICNCGKDKLVDSQVRIKHLISLRRSLADPGGATTGFTFD